MTKRGALFLFFSLLLVGTSFPTYADPPDGALTNVLRLSDFLPGVDFTYMEGKFIELTPPQVLHIMSGIEHTLNNPITSITGYPQFYFDSLDAGQRGIVSLIIAKAARVIELLYQGHRGEPVNSAELTQRLCAVAPILAELRTLIFNFTLPSPDSLERMKSDISRILNVVDLTLRVLRKREGSPTLNIGAFSNLWVLIKMAKDSKRYSEVHGGNFFYEDPWMGSYVLSDPSQALFRFSLLAFFVDTKAQQRISLGDGKLIIEIPLAVLKEGTPWECKKRRGGGLDVFLAKLYLEEYFGASIEMREGEGVVVQIPLPQDFPMKDLHSEIEAIERPESIVSVLQELRGQSVETEEILRKREMQLLVERTAHDLFERFPRREFVTPLNLKIFLQGRSGGTSFFLDERGEQLPSFVRDAQSWDVPTIRDILNRAFRELKRVP